MIYMGYFCYFLAIIFLVLGLYYGISLWNKPDVGPMIGIFLLSRNFIIAVIVALLGANFHYISYLQGK